MKETNKYFEGWIKSTRQTLSEFTLPQLKEAREVVNAFIEALEPKPEPSAAKTFLLPRDGELTKFPCSEKQYRFLCDLAKKVPGSAIKISKGDALKFLFFGWVKEGLDLLKAGTPVIFDYEQTAKL